MKVITYLSLTILYSILLMGCSHYFVKCIDGNKVLVHKNPEKAYPIYAKEYNVVLKNSISLNNTIFDSTNIEFKNRVIEFRDRASQSVIESENIHKQYYMILNNHPCDTAIRNAYIKATDNLLWWTFEIRKANVQLEKLLNDKRISKTHMQIKADSIFNYIIEIASNKLDKYSYNINQENNNNSKNAKIVDQSRMPSIILNSVLHNSNVLLPKDSLLGTLNDSNIYNYFDRNLNYLENISNIEYIFNGTMYSSFNKDSIMFERMLIYITCDTIKYNFDLFDNKGIIKLELLDQKFPNINNPNNLIGKYQFTLAVKDLDPNLNYNLNLFLFFRNKSQNRVFITSTYVEPFKSAK